jgi:hypothetical protein
VASEVDICNLGLSHLGDTANLQAISPPDGSAQADHCARWYPIARDELLEMHDWSWATKRVALAQLSNPITEWTYCYAQPNDLLSAIAVMDPSATDDSSVAVPAPSMAFFGYSNPVINTGVYTPQEFTCEAAADGSDVLYTNQANAILRYIARVTDTSKFSSTFIQALAASLASMLAGPVIKGEAGEAAAARWREKAFGRDGKSGMFAKAVQADVGNKHTNVRERHAVSWINAR